MNDHYKTLGVDRSASMAEIKQAFRKLASQHHPDKGGDTQRFQEIQAAYDVLGDPHKKAEYDNPAQPFAFHQFGGAHVNINDLFGMFGQGFGGFGHHPRRSHVRMSMPVTLREVAEGVKKTVAVANSQGQSAIEIAVPLGINDGDNVHYEGLAPGGQDLVICFRIKPDAVWQRDGLNLVRPLNVSVWDLITGGDVVVQNILNHRLTITVPPKSQPNTVLRVRSQGLRDQKGRTGDMLVRLQAMIPTGIAPEIIEAIKKYR